MVETKISGFLWFAHECLKTLPKDVYDQMDPLHSTVLAKRLERHLRPRKKTKRAGTIVNAILEAVRERETTNQN